MENVQKNLSLCVQCIAMPLKITDNTSSLSALLELLRCILMPYMWGGHCPWLHFTGGVIEAQRGELTFWTLCPESLTSEPTLWTTTPPLFPHYVLSGPLY